MWSNASICRFYLSILILVHSTLTSYQNTQPNKKLNILYSYHNWNLLLSKLLCLSFFKLFLKLPCISLYQIARSTYPIIHVAPTTTCSNSRCILLPKMTFYMLLLHRTSLPSAELVFGLSPDQVYQAVDI